MLTRKKTDKAGGPIVGSCEPVHEKRGGPEERGKMQESDGPRIQPTEGRGGGTRIRALAGSRSVRHPIPGDEALLTEA